MMVSRSRRERDSRSSFQTTTTSPARSWMEEPEELGAVPTTAGSLLAKDALATSGCERGDLSGGVLLIVETRA